MAVTIRDVAKAAGVSVATVSRVINNNPFVAAGTSERVKKTMKTLGFFPNSIAKNFAQQNTNTVALIIDINKSGLFANPFFHETVDGIEKVIYANGYYLLIANENTLIKHETALNRLMLEKRVDGLILPSSILDKNLIQKINTHRFPVVILGEPEINTDSDWVDIDNRLAGEQAAEHLIANSYRRIAFIGGNQRDLFYQNRLIGYRNALAQNGIEPDPVIVRPGEDSRENGAKFVAELLALDQRPDAAIFNSHVTAFGAIDFMKEAGLSIPEDFGIVCFDDSPLAEFTKPPLTTVAIDLRDLGARAAAILLQSIANPGSSRQHTLIATRIIVRKSSIKLKLN